MNSSLKCLRSTYIILLSAALFGAIPASAQFYSLGSDPGRLGWKTGRTDHYRFIYPSGTDSLAASYAVQFEKYTEGVAISSGLVLKGGKKRKFPVILHPYHGIPNASVTWAPKRLDIFTLADAYDPEPLPWAKTLAIHEGRHISQMQFGYRGWLKPLTIILGDMAQGAYSAIWPNTWMLEGDAVVAETALTDAGRGRSADFLEYYRAAFPQGDWRNWDRWRYGSYRHYTPDHYALGYLTIAGVRYCFDDPLYTERYFDRLRKNPFRFGNTKKTVKMASGMNFKESFRTVMQTANEIWEEEAASREPFIPCERVSGQGRWYTELKGCVGLNGKIYGITSGLADAPALVEINPADGSTRKLRAFSGNTGRLSSDGIRLWWSETLPDERWTLEMSSAIRYYTPDSGRAGTLVRKGRLFNPVPSADGKTIAAVSLPVEGGSGINLIDAGNGAVLKSLRLPDSIQAAEVCYVGNYLYFTAISEGGAGIYRVTDNLDGKIETVVGPLPVSIRNMREENGKLMFACDRTGTNECYEYFPDSEEVAQLTSLRNGGAEFCRAGDNIYFTVQSGDDKMLHRASWESLLHKNVNFNDIHKYKVADILTAQERELAMGKGISWPDSLASPDISLQDVKHYRKAAHILRFHSWAPLYFDYDKISSLSADYNYEYASAGATALFQNDLGTAWGSIGYSWHKDPYSYAYDGTKHRHSGHIRLSYSGLYPVFELSADINDRAAIQYRRRQTVSAGDVSENMTGVLLDNPHIEGRVKAYIPFNFSSGGWLKGLIPQAEYTISNDRFNKSAVRLTYDGNFNGFFGAAHFLGYEAGRNVLMQKVTASLRGYVMRPVAASEVYPQFGIGAEAGYSGRAGLEDMFTSSAYGYIYGYLPGITRTQGLRLAALYQHQQSEGLFKENTLDLDPRGFANSGADWYLRAMSRNHLKISADYAIPIYFGDISCFSPLFYIKNFELTPHFDFTMFSEGKSITDGNLFSAGVKVLARLANLLWVPYDCGIGITVDWNGGSAFDRIKKSGCRMDSHYIGFEFNISL